MNRTVFGVICGLILVLGCGRRAQEKTIEKTMEKQLGGNAKVNISDDGVTLRTDKSDIRSGKAAKIPDDFPSDVYIPEGAAISMAMKRAKGFMLALLCKEDVRSVADRYKKEMTDKGWTEDTCMDQGTQVVLAYKKEGRKANMSISSAGGSTRIALATQ